MIEKVRNIQTWIKRGKKDILVIAGWSIAIALIMIKNHWFFYLENPKFSVYKIAYRFTEGPLFTELDYLLLVTASFLVGMILIDVKTIVYGYMVSMCLSSSMAVAYIFLYIWFVLGLGRVLSLTPFDWEWALFFALLNVFRFMFPMGMTFCLIGVTVGSFLRGWLKT